MGLQVAVKVGLRVYDSLSAARTIGEEFGDGGGMGERGGRKGTGKVCVGWGGGWGARKWCLLPGKQPS